MDGLVQCLGLGDPVSQLSNADGSSDRASRYHDKNFINQPYSPSLLGKYWCQVINTTADPDQPLMRSSVFTLLAPGNYSVVMCNDAVQSRDNITCADLSNRIETTTSHLSQILKTATTAAMFTAITQTSLSVHAHTPITTPTQASDEQQLSSVIAVMGVVIAIFGLLAVGVIVIIVIKWRQSKKVADSI